MDAQANTGVVYLVQHPPAMMRNGVPIEKDLSSAQRYGKVLHILGPRDQASLAPGPCLFKIKKTLRDFNPETDFLCYAGGDPHTLLLVGFALRDLNIRDARFLRWERERDTEGRRKPGGFYVPVGMP